jgi:hypothetical protein
MFFLEQVVHHDIMYAFCVVFEDKDPLINGGQPNIDVNPIKSLGDRHGEIIFVWVGGGIRTLPCTYRIGLVRYRFGNMHAHA